MKKQLFKHAGFSMQVAAAMLASSLLLTGCGASSSPIATGTVNGYASDSYSTDYKGEMWNSDEAWNEGAAYEEEYEAAAPAEGVSASLPSPASPEMGSSDAGSAEDYGQKLVYTYYFDFETLHFDDSVKYVEDKVAALGGYIENSSIYGTTYRDSSLTVRIPADRTQEFLSDTSSIGEITSQRSSAEDITLQYYDVQSRLESLHAQHDRLIDLLDRAENLSDIAQLEAQLSNVEYEIGSYQTRMNVMKNQIHYVTMYLTINEVVQITEKVEDTFLTRIQKGLSSNLRDLREGFIDFAVWFITYLPNMLVDAVLIVIAIFVIIKIGKLLRRVRAKAHEDISLRGRKNGSSKGLFGRRRKGNSDAASSEENNK